MQHAVRTAEILAVVLAAGAAGFAIANKNGMAESFERLHAGRHVEPAGADWVHHHGGHGHAGMMQRLGEVEFSGATIAVYQVGQAKPGTTATFVLNGETTVPGLILEAWTGAEVSADYQPVIVADLGSENHLHLEMPASPAEQRLFLRVNTEMQSVPLR